MTETSSKLLLKAVAVLWIIWGLVHAFAGVMTISQAAPASIAGVADAVDPALFHATYQPATDALVNQHGFNLLWIGLFTTVGGVFIWQGSATWLLFTGLVGGLTDVGYFVYMDLGGFVHFFPGTVMTLVSGSAVILSAILYATGRQSGDQTERMG
ncbi:MAG: hypothetical protein AAFY03_07080 [Pseudomonadota bacterium]